MHSHFSIPILSILSLSLTLCACGQAESQLTSTLPPTQTIQPTPTTQPTATQTLTPTLEPTATITPTATLKPGQEWGLVESAVTDGQTLWVTIHDEATLIRYAATFGGEFTVRSIEKEAERVNRAFVEDQVVLLEEEPLEPDWYRYVFLQDGTFVNAELIRLGLYFYDGSSEFIYHDELAAAEEQAKASQLGRWKERPTPIPSVCQGGFGGALTITDIFYQGTKPGESDEYIEITNTSDMNIIVLDGYWITSEKTRNKYIFPDYIALVPGEACRVYTNEEHPSCNGRSMGIWSPSPVWDNEGDCAYLYSPTGDLVSQCCY